MNVVAKRVKEYERRPPRSDRHERYAEDRRRARSSSRRLWLVGAVLLAIIAAAALWMFFDFGSTQDKDDGSTGSEAPVSLDELSRDVGPSQARS